METRIDERVLEVQQWLNLTYGTDSRFNRVDETGRTGWDTIYGLRRALQIELGIQETSNSFGPTTYSLCPTIVQGAEGNLVRIVQGGLWCKGYNPGGFGDYYGNGTYAAVKALKTDAGFPSASGNMQRDFMKALLDMSAFKVIGNGSEEIRTIQQQLNYDYYDYYQICPCDGLYNRDMNKMLIYALQKELGIAKASATGTWGPTTISLCKTKNFSVGSSSLMIKLVRYATVCNGFSVSTASSTYDSTLDTEVKNFCNKLLILKPTNQINYTVIKSLLSSNGDTDRSALGCDTATKLSATQIETIKNAGYKYIGRYLTNTPGGTLDKRLSITEINNILKSGLKLFAIFQESGNGADSFSHSIGYTNGQRAHDAAKDLGIPEGSTIYFAVDFDPTDDVISSNIIEYFSGIAISNAPRRYKIGVYGTRNVCNRLRDSLSAEYFFVSDASYGFSGNLGFNIPSNWCFDQFSTDITIGSGSGQVSIDKVAVSGKDIGISKINTNNRKLVEEFLKTFSIDVSKIDSDLSFEKETHCFIKAPTTSDRNYISLNTYVGMNLNFSGSHTVNIVNGKYDSSEIELTNSLFPNTSTEIKSSISAGLNTFAYNVSCQGINNVEICFGVHVLATDRDPGIMYIYEMISPILDQNGVETYLKAELIFRSYGPVDGGNMNSSQYTQESTQAFIASMMAMFAYNAEKAVEAINDVAKSLNIPTLDPKYATPIAFVCILALVVIAFA